MKRSMLIAASSLCLFLVAADRINSDPVAETYDNELIGNIRLESWGKPNNGLRCRLSATEFHYGDSPTVLLEVQNISNKPVDINDVFSNAMLLSVSPLTRSSYDTDFLWLYDSGVLRIPLKPQKIVRAVCKISGTFFPLPD